MGQLADRLVAGFIALPCLFLLGLSTRSSVAAFIALPQDTILEKARLGADVSGEQLIDAGKANLRAARWFESARYRTVAASALIAATHVGTRIDPARIEQPIRQSLAAAPASPFNWFRLALLRFQAGDAPGAAQAWRMSVSTGRFNPAVMLPRLNLGLRLLRSQNREFEEEMADQIRLLAQADPMRLADFAQQTDSAPAVRRVLASDQSSSKAFESAIRQIQHAMLERTGIRFQ